MESPQLLHSADGVLRERVKELTCLYGIAQVAADTDALLDSSLRKIVDLLPPAWQYPEICSARIVLDGCFYATPGFREDLPTQSADIVIAGVPRGMVQVAYSEPVPELDDGPFLKEERSLIDAVARQVAVIVERRQARDERKRLQDQLDHADRLATIGMLAAGVAHELNEPLSSILGFAQLARKSPDLSDQTKQDLKKIEAAALHAREVIRKLLVFSRQMPPEKKRANLNDVIDEGLFLLASRCAREGITCVRSLSPDLPEIVADPGQINQILVNLVVNAVQAMPQGGRLTVATFADAGHVVLAVEDTGVGMSESVLGRIFIPFFTTKDVGQGTGLGLPVVHGIVTSHGGLISATSTPGQGSRFEVRFPIAGDEENAGHAPGA